MWKSTGPRSAPPAHESRPHTNVIVSGLNFPGNGRLILELAFRGRYELCRSPFILEEVAEVLQRRKFDWTEERSSQALRALGNAATVIDPRRLPGGDRGRPRLQPHLGVRYGGFRRLPSDWRPTASAAHWRASRCERPERSPLPVILGGKMTPVYGWPAPIAYRFGKEVG